MWPWGHAAFGYLLYSFGSRLFGSRPSGYPTIVLLVATQLPDLVDKPLSWVFELFPQGYSVGHSVFVAVPLGIAVLALAVWRHRIEYGIAFIVGYWSHLVGDIVLGLVGGNPYTFARVLWPVVTLPPYSSDLSALARIHEYISAFLYLLSTEGATGPLMIALMIYFGPFLFAILVWLVDGAPGITAFRRLFSSPD
ncbi:metal-dependent hydrolase [Halocatena marina]|uniref:Metal-dependent hydrolase n=1 Tax=Halocatena marina TaxID=2934937 RepID=A0ABD5YLH8_9EURY|nr:metal-dependent hydrolase [Halocatena marina]